MKNMFSARPLHGGRRRNLHDTLQDNYQRMWKKESFVLDAVAQNGYAILWREDKTRLRVSKQAAKHLVVESDQRTAGLWVRFQSQKACPRFFSPEWPVVILRGSTFPNVPQSIRVSPDHCYIRVFSLILMVMAILQRQHRCVLTRGGKCQCSQTPTPYS